MSVRLSAALISILALATVGCSRPSDTATQRQAARAATAPPAVPSADASTPTASSPTPNASSQPAATESAKGTSSTETAKGTDKPMSSMDKNEETKAMPQPGQVNDHSTVAEDPKAPK